MAIRTRRTSIAQRLTPSEATLANALADILRFKVRVISAQGVADFISNANIEEWGDILQEAGIQVVQARLVDALRKAYGPAATGSFIDVLEKYARPGIPILQDPGIRLDNGIIVPSSMAPDLITTQLNPADRVMLDYINPRAVDYAQTRAAQLVTDISEANRRSLRWMLTDSVSRGVSVPDTTRVLRQTIGLHRRWARAVVNYDTRTYGQLLDAGMSSGRARARADVLTKRYRDKLIRARAEMIARTEFAMAGNMARQTGWDAAYRTGVLDGSSMKEWKVAPSGSSRGAPCDVCAGLSGKRVQWNAAFPTGHIMPPAHPHCRCTAVLVPPSRGLSGLPSQDLAAWRARLAEMDEAV